MHSISAHDALSYALSQQLARLYALILAGWLLLGIGMRTQAAQDLTIRYLLGYPLLVTGVIALYSGTIALLFKIVVDANTTASTS